MKSLAKSVLFLVIITVTTQEIGRRGCDCEVCKGVTNSVNPVLGKKLHYDGKSNCNICDQRKERIRMEKEKQKQLQKCPFEILGSPTIKEKTSEEAFDEFRELLVPSQNGFFDLMRGIVKTMHGSSVMELRWAKEKEGRELAQKMEEMKREEELRQMMAKLNENTPPQLMPINAEKSLFLERFAKETNTNERAHLITTEKSIVDLEIIEYPIKDELAGGIHLEDDFKHSYSRSGEFPEQTLASEETSLEGFVNGDIEIQSPPKNLSSARMEYSHANGKNT